MTRLTHEGASGVGERKLGAAGKAERAAHLVTEATAATTGQAGLDQGDAAKRKLTQKDS